MDINLLKQVWDQASEMVMVINKNYELLYFNRTYSDMVQRFKQAEIRIGDPVITGYEDCRSFAAQVLGRWKRALQGECFSWTNKLVTNEGAEVFYVINYNCLKDEQGEVIGAFCTGNIIRVIEEQQKSATHKSIFLSDFLESLKGVAIVTITDIEGNVVEANDMFYQVTGLQPGGQQPLHFDEFYDTGEWERLQPLIATSLMAGKIWRGEMKLISRSGEHFWHDTIINPIRNEEGRIDSFLSIRYDITARKNAEENLKLAEQRWNYALYSNGDGVWDWNLENNTVYYSPRWKALLGFRDDELANHHTTWKKLIHPDDIATSDREVENHIAGVKDYYSAEVRLLCKDGTYRWMLDRGRIVEWNDDGTPRRFVGTHTDIHKQKEQEQQIRDNENLLNQFIDNLPLGVSLLSPDGTTLRNNHAVMQMLALEPTEGTTFPLNIYEAEESLQENFMDMFRIAAGKQELVRTRVVADLSKRRSETDPDNQKVYIDLTLFPLKGEEGKTRAVFVLYHDVTRSCLYEEELKQSQESLNRIIDFLPIGFQQYDKDGFSVRMNREQARILGFDDVTYGLGEFNILTDPLSVSFGTAQTFMDVKLTKKAIRTEFKVDFGIAENKWNTISNSIYIDTTAFPILNDKGEIISLIVLMNEITDRKLKELEIHKSQELLRETGKLARIAGWELDVSVPGKQELKWSRELFEIYEMDEGENSIEVPKAIEFYTPEARPVITDALRLCIREGKAFDLELPFYTLKGNRRMARAMGKADYRDGEIYRVHGVFQDITEQYNIRNELSRNNQLMLSLFDNIDMGYMAFDFEKRITFVNQRIQNIYPGIDFIGKSIYDIFPEVSGTLIERIYDQVVSTSIPQSFEECLGFTDGWHEYTVSPIGNEGAGVFARNISARKHMENDLKEANEKLQLLNEYLSNQNRQLEDFTHIISHNLRSPVANLNALIGLYHDADDDEERATYIQMLKEVIANATQTLNELIEVVQVKKDVNREKERIWLEESLRRSREVLVADIEQCKAVVEHDFAAAQYVEYPKIYIDSIMQNLLSNAIKYRDESRQLYVRFETFVSEGRVMLVVSDNGLGIDMKKHADKLFGFRKTFHKNKDSKGLGLFITRNQVEAMGGNIVAESTPGIGTRFIITF